MKMHTTPILPDDETPAMPVRGTPGLRADRRSLARAFPSCFNPPRAKTPKRPLKVGITTEVLALGVTGEDGQPLSRSRIRRAVHDYCTGSKYEAALVTGAVRIDLDGNPAGTVTAEQANHHPHPTDTLTMEMEA